MQKYEENISHCDLLGNTNMLVKESMFSHSLAVWYHMFVAQTPMSALSHTAHRFSQVTWCHNTLTPCSSHAMTNGERNSYSHFSGRLLSKALHCISTLSHHPHTPAEPSGAFQGSVSCATIARNETTDILISGRSALCPAPLMHLKDHYTDLALESKQVQQNQISSFIPHISFPRFKKQQKEKPGSYITHNSTWTVTVGWEVGVCHLSRS